MKNPPSTILPTTYFGPVEWYHRLYRADCVLLEACESYTKQTYRNRCVIATTNGPQTLTVPVEHSTIHPSPSTLHPSPSTIKDIRISNHGSWRRVHWNALQSAYSESPFFDYYADDLRPFFERDYEFLYDYNLEIIHTVCQLLDIHPHIGETTEWCKETSSKRLSTNGAQESDFVARPYWQVFDRKHGFLPNLSILDLLFCKGPEAVFWL